jgi:hypothetical protein
LFVPCLASSGAADSGQQVAITARLWSPSHGLS